jgi:uncharacterized membrane protein YccC
MNYTFDGAAAMAILASLAGWLPPAAAVIGIIWYAIQIWESRTLQDWVQRRYARKIVRLAAKLAALQLHSEANAASIELRGAAKAAAQTLKTDAQEAINSASKSVAYDHEKPKDGPPIF